MATTTTSEGGRGDGGGLREREERVKWDERDVICWDSGIASASKMEISCRPLTNTTMAPNLHPNSITSAVPTQNLNFLCPDLSKTQRPLPPKPSSIPLLSPKYSPSTQHFDHISGGIIYLSPPSLRIPSEPHKSHKSYLRPCSAVAAPFLPAFRLQRTLPPAGAAPYVVPVTRDTRSPRSLSPTATVRVTISCTRAPKSSGNPLSAMGAAVRRIEIHGSRMHGCLRDAAWNKTLICWLGAHGQHMVIGGRGSTGVRRHSPPFVPSPLFVPGCSDSIVVRI